MKKFVAALFALAIPLSLVNAQTLQALGTYTGSVAPKCVATTSTFEGDLDETPPTGDNFTNSISGTGVFSYRSNTENCNITSIDPEVIGAPTELAKQNAVGSCVADGGNDLGIATPVGGLPVTVTGSITDGGNDQILLAGEYTLTCTVNLSAL